MQWLVLTESYYMGECPEHYPNNISLVKYMLTFCCRLKYAFYKKIGNSFSADT